MGQSPRTRETTGYEPFERETTGYEPFERETTGYEPFEKETTGYEPTGHWHAPFKGVGAVGLAIDHVLHVWLALARKLISPRVFLKIVLHKPIPTQICHFFLDHY